MVEFVIKATGKFNRTKDDPGWIIQSKNPKFTSLKLRSYEDAFEDFKSYVSAFVKELIPAGSPEIDFGEPIISVKTEDFTNIGEKFTLRPDAKECSLKWTITITHQVNRTLAEFETQPTMSECQENVTS